MEHQKEDHLKELTEEDKKIIRLMAKIYVEHIIKEADKKTLSDELNPIKSKVKRK